MRTIRFSLLVYTTVMFGLVPSITRALPTNELLNLGMSWGTEQGDQFGRFDYADKMVKMGFIWHDREIDQQEMRFYTSAGESQPTGRERFRPGIVFRSNRDNRQEWMRAGDPAPVKAYMSLECRFGPNAFLDIDYPMASSIDGQRCYPRLSTDGLELAFIKRRYTLALTADIVWDFDPLQGGFKIDAGLLWRNSSDSVEVRVLTREFQVRFGKDLAF